jgi:putative SOS response-associated peptidase YedK
MCGRYATSRSALDLRALFEAEDETDDGLAPDYNVAPTDPVPIVRNSQRAGRVLSVARWGLVPPWAKDTRGAARMINARVETVATARAYATSFARRRCLVPADGWYEWRRLSVRDRQAYFMTLRDGGVMAFAGLWTVWGEQRLLTTTIITVPAVGDFGAVHDRMPLVLEPSRWSDWLTAEPSERTDLLVPPEDEYLSTVDIRPVGPRVGDVRNDGPELIEPVPAPPLGSAAATFTDLTLF